VPDSDILDPPREGPLNLARWCLERWATDPATAGRPAFTFARPGGDDDTWSYAEVWDRVEAVARALVARGLTPGERVLVRLPHSPAYAFTFFGATLAGLVPIPASPQLTDEEASFLVDDAAVAAVIGDAGGLPSSGSGGRAGDWLVLDPADLDGPAGTPLPETDAEDPAFLVYTSGTTSHPKGALHAHRTVGGRAMVLRGWEGFTPDDVTLHPGTLNWTYTMGVGLMDAWTAGAHACLFSGPNDPAGWPALLERLGVTIFMAVPTVFRQLLKYSRPEDFDLRLRHVLVAGEPLPVALYEEWRERVGTEMYECLGMTEISTYISSGPPTPVRLGSPGKPQPGRRVAILPDLSDEETSEDDRAVDSSDATTPLPPGEIGLLAVHRSDPGLLLRYWQRPEEDAAVRRGEWFVGGDRAAIDEDGYVWFHGRADDVIKSFGYRLSPLEIETALEAHPHIAEAAVIGETVEEGKTLVTACLVPSDGVTIDEHAIAAYASQHLAEYKRPHQYRVVASLPRTRNGKLQRRALAESGE
jgi:acyl-coenzyme A synthetase/AMP-(fatty) acid ligase